MTQHIDIIKQASGVVEITSDVKGSASALVEVFMFNSRKLLSIDQDIDTVHLTKAEVEALITVLTELKEQM